MEFRATCCFGYYIGGLTKPLLHIGLVCLFKMKLTENFKIKALTFFTSGYWSFGLYGTALNKPELHIELAWSLK